MNDPEFVEWVKENKDKVDSLNLLMIDSFLDSWIKLVNSAKKSQLFIKINSEVDYFDGHIWVSRKRFLKKLYFMKSTLER